MLPTSTFNIPKAWRTKVTKRWRELEPKVKWAERDPLVRQALQFNHFSLLVSLLHQGFQMRVVRRQSLDDVTLSAEELARRKELSLAASQMLKQKRKPQR
jgi:hypothetical protein